MSRNPYTGGCLCEAVRYEVRGPLRDVIACHCRQCRRVSSHHVAATAAWPEDLVLTNEEGLAWYDFSPYLRRGFCANCGSTLFFDHGKQHPTGIAAGSLDGDPAIKLAIHIYVDEAGGYYEVPDDGLQKADSQSWRKLGWDALAWTGDPTSHVAGRDSPAD
jgi:hypothetical protein